MNKQRKQRMNNVYMILLKNVNKVIYIVLYCYIVMYLYQKIY